MTQLRVFSLKNLPKLKEVSIGSSCGCPSKNNTDENTWFVINSCPSLESIVIGDNSFQNYSSFKLKNLPSLKSLTIGMNCFCETVFQLRKYYVRGFYTTKQMSLGINSRCIYRSIVLMSILLFCFSIDLPKLKSISIGSDSFHSSSSDVKNELVMHRIPCQYVES